MQRSILLVAAVLLVGCVGAPQPAQTVNPDPVPGVAETHSGPDTIFLSGVFGEGVGTPQAGPVPFTIVGMGEVAKSVIVRDSLRPLNATLTWSSQAPARLELHLQSPHGNVTTYAPPGLSLDGRIEATLLSPEPGTWTIGISPEGPAANVAWNVTIVGDVSPWS